MRFWRYDQKERNKMGDEKGKRILLPFFAPVSLNVGDPRLGFFAKKPELHVHK